MKTEKQSNRVESLLCWSSKLEPCYFLFLVTVDHPQANVSLPVASEETSEESQGRG